MGRNKALNKMRKQGIAKGDMKDLGQGRIAVFVRHENDELMSAFESGGMGHVEAHHEGRTGKDSVNRKHGCESESRKLLRLKLKNKMLEKRSTRMGNQMAQEFGTGEVINTTDTMDWQSKLRINQVVSGIQQGVTIKGVADPIHTLKREDILNPITLKQHLIANHIMGEGQ
tara:strand:- start:18112 stop:18624 length:513 start_codon:yes stop_codon:yes gene_type:complete